MVSMQQEADIIITNQDGDSIASILQSHVSMECRSLEAVTFMRAFLNLIQKRLAREPPKPLDDPLSCILVAQFGWKAVPIHPSKPWDHPQQAYRVKRPRLGHEYQAWYRSAETRLEGRYTDSRISMAPELPRLKERNIVLKAQAGFDAIQGFDFSSSTMTMSDAFVDVISSATMDELLKEALLGIMAREFVGKWFRCGDDKKLIACLVNRCGWTIVARTGSQKSDPTKPGCLMLRHPRYFCFIGDNLYNEVDEVVEPILWIADWQSRIEVRKIRDERISRRRNRQSARDKAIADIRFLFKKHRKRDKAIADIRFLFK